MKSAEKDAAGKVLAREMRSLERYLSKHHVPPEEVRDIVCQAILLTWQHLTEGRIKLSENPEDFGPTLAKYLFGVVRGLMLNRRKAREITVRFRRADLPEMPEGVSHIEATIELASELRAQPPSLHRFLLTLMSAGTLAETARDLRISDSAASDAMKRAREYASGERPAPRRRPKK